MFCRLILHETGLILVQSWPLGQQMAAVTELLVLRARQTVAEGQQKSEGSEPPQGVRDLSPPHVVVSLAVSRLAVSRLPPACGSKSSGTHTTRADAGSSSIESARALKQVDESIVVVQSDIWLRRIE